MTKAINADQYINLLEKLEADPVATLAELEADYEAQLLTADSYALIDIEYAINQARAAVSRDAKRSEAATALKLANEAKAKQATAKRHQDASKAIAADIQTKLNEFNKLSAQLVALSKEVELLQPKMIEQMMLAKHHGAGEHIRFNPVVIDPSIMAIKVISSVAHQGYMNV